MFSTLFYTTLLVLAPIAKVAAFAVNSPNITECGDVRITWEDTGSDFYDVWIVNPSDPCADPYVDLGADHKQTSMTWNAAAVPAGLKVQISIQNAEGDEAWSSAITVGAGNSSACKIPTELEKLAPKPSSSSVSASASATAAKTTLVITPTTTAAASESTASDISDEGVQAVGAAAGNAASRAHVSTPVVLIGTLLGAAFFAL